MATAAVRLAPLYTRQHCIAPLYTAAAYTRQVHMSPNMHPNMHPNRSHELEFPVPLLPIPYVPINCCR